MIFEGRSKRIYESSHAGVAILEFKSEFPRSHDAKNTPKLFKSHFSATICHHLFSYLHSFRIPNHYIERYEKKELAVKRLEMIPVAVVIRNIAAGALCTRFSVPEGKEMEFPIVELIYKSESLNNPVMNESHIFAFGISTPEEVRTMIRIATKTNAVLRSFAERRRLRLVDMWLEFGRADGQILLGDEISPDTCRFLDTETNQLFDGTIYRLGVGNYRDGYQALYQKLTA